MKPFRIEIIGEPLLTLDQFRENAKTCDGIPRIPKEKPHGGRLAIVGGGPSIINHLNELRAWNGPIWAINNTAAWLVRQGISAIMITVDPAPPEQFDTEGVDYALLASYVHPKLRDKFAEVGIFDLYEIDPENGIKGGTTTASRACSLATYLGFFDVTLFGCEGSFQIGQDHVDRAENRPDIFIIKAGGVDYATYAEWMMQSELLAKLVTLAPNVFKQKSGGLLQAMVEHPDWEVVAVSESLRDHLIEVNGDQGIYDSPYEFAAA